MTSHRPIAVNTLGDVLASPCYALWAHCDQCRRSMKLDPAQLAATYGADLEIADPKRRLKCAQCGRPRQRVEASTRGDYFGGIIH